MLQNNSLVGQKPFGRRVDYPPQPQRTSREVAAASARETAAADNPVDRFLPVAPDLAPAVDPELAEWKKARRQKFRLPWRQLYFLGTLFFGIASLALPDTVNDEVQWLLYALMAASLYAGFTARRRRVNP
jgi:hypothetical protein